ncbi:TRAP transporter substrate-binding protein [Oscillibacter sp.]|uniref:TRAP transporter substrate-binding protein n=1 Tax=Oscillibacter sp. TaxID=1945593 RepID=UPI0026190498|nr:TRAP transporter substrate-binding protein [Oscillibacter sp.]MDD3347855.1 TRAP transporter substrate-binding protein [Oscillibacter sp.]
MKKAMSMILASLMLVSLLTACGGSSEKDSGTATPEAPAADDTVYTLLAAYTVAEDPNSQHTTRFDKLKELVEERTDGHVIIDIHPGGELGTEQEYIEMMQNGELAFSSVSSAVMAGFTDAFVFADCPFLFRDQDQAIAFTQSDVAREHMDTVEDLGLYCLDLASVGDRNFLTVKNKPITCLADMKGMKLRTMQTQIQVDAIGMMGAQATPLSYNECYQSMQTNVIDGMENEVDTYLAMRFYEVAPNYTKAGWLQLFHPLLASKELIDQLPKEYQDIIWEAAHEACVYSTTNGQAYAKGAAADALQAANVNVIKIEDNSEFKQALTDGGLFETYADKIGQDVIEWVNAN